MIYRHKITGVEIDVNGGLSGAWEPVNDALQATSEEAPNKTPAPKKKPAARPSAKGAVKKK